MKSHVSDYLELMYAIYKDACTHCATETSKRDLKTIRSRVQSQGLSFLTIALPAFATDFERALSQGRIASTQFQYFRKSGSIPAFLREMTKLVFDKETGVKLDDTPISVKAISSVRQICLAFKKVQLPCSPKRVAKAMENFIQVEHELSTFSIPEEAESEYRLISSMLWDNIMAGLQLDMLVPRHGPGNTADRCSPNGKYRWRVWHERLQPFFPVDSAVYPHFSGDDGAMLQVLENVSFVFPEQELPSRVVQVPKTLKGPRIIALEPCCMQYAQQGIRNGLYDLLESSSLTKGHINFRDQSVNQRLAMSSSIDGLLATIDLSDASDRVPRNLALRMFDGNPDLRDAIDACRSLRADVGGVVILLSKFASMGNALCFPVEAMYFYTICVMALLKSRGLRVSYENLERVSRDVYVYGDDIIVPVDDVVTVFEYLQKYNCKVNSRKTFYSGSFRESCGVDAYNGTNVTPVYVTRDLPKNRQNSDQILSAIAAGNHFYKRGYWRTMEWLFNRVERIIGPLPSVPIESDVLGRCFPWPRPKLRRRFNRKLQVLEVRTWVSRPVYQDDPLEGIDAVQKSLLRLQEMKSLDVERDKKHSERSVRHGAVAIQRRWINVQKTY